MSKMNKVTTTNEPAVIWWFCVISNREYQKNQPKEYCCYLGLEVHDTITYEGGHEYDYRAGMDVDEQHFDTFEEALAWSKQRTQLDLDYEYVENGRWRAFSDDLTELPTTSKAAQ